MHEVRDHSEILRETREVIAAHEAGDVSSAETAQKLTALMNETVTCRFCGEPQIVRTSEGARVCWSCGAHGPYSIDDQGDAAKAARLVDENKRNR